MVNVLGEEGAAAGAGVDAGVVVVAVEAAAERAWAAASCAATVAAAPGAFACRVVSQTSSGTTRENAPRKPSQGSRAPTRESIMVLRVGTPLATAGATAAMGAGIVPIRAWSRLSSCCLFVTLVF